MSLSRASDSPETVSDLDRRTVLKAGAWSVPVVLAATAVPLAAASTGPACEDGPVNLTALGWSAVGQLESNWGTDTTTGWVGAFQGSPGGDATQNVTSITDGFLSQDDNDSTTDVATVTMTMSLEVVEGATYTFQLPVAVGHGNPGGEARSARQSLVVDALQPGGGSIELLKLTVNHWGAAAITPSDSEMEANGYILQNTWGGPETYPVSFTASGTGTATLQFVFTIEPKIDDDRPDNRTDDISVGIPLITQQTCPPPQ